MQEKIKDLPAQFLSQLGYTSPYEVAVSLDEANKIYQVSITTSDPAILIGYHGDTISALQLLLAQHLHSQTGEWSSISINVNDYRERREQALQAMADTVVARVIATTHPEALPPLPANERRIIHMYLTDHPQVVTESQGEGRFRTVVVSPKA